MKNIFILAIFGFLLVAGCIGTPDNTVVTIDAPISVSKGTDFKINVIVENTDSKPHELRSIDIEEAFLKGVYIKDTTPKTTEDYTAFGDHVYEFRKQIPANSELKVTLNVNAVKAGDFPGEFDICIDADATCLSKSTRVVIE